MWNTGLPDTLQMYENVGNINESDLILKNFQCRITQTYGV